MADEARGVAGQLVMADLPAGGTEAVINHLDHYPFGGITLHQWDTGEATELRQRMTMLWQALAKAALPPPLVALTEEGGTVHRFPEVVRPPSAMSLGQGNDLELTQRVGQLWGRYLMSQGINWNWAPVADVLTEVQNPVIGTRAFSQDSDRVARHVAAWIRGHQAEGILATAKHFPGHGMTQLDSHLARPVCSLAESELAGHLVPYDAAIEAGVKAMMLSHVIYSEFDALPATLSSYWYQRLRTMGFGGLVVTDALSMRAIGDVYAPGEAAVRAITAGADIIDSGSWEIAVAALEAIAQAYEQDRTFRRRADDARERVLAVKAHLRPPEAWPASVSTEQLAEVSWQSALTGARIIRGDPQRFTADCPSFQTVWMSSRHRVEVEERGETSEGRASVVRVDLSGRGWREELSAIFDQSGALLLFTENVWRYPEVIAQLRKLSLRRPVLHVAVLDPVDVDRLPETKVAVAIYGNFEYAAKVIDGLIFAPKTAPAGGWEIRGSDA